MKKENRKLAQQRRAAERKQQKAKRRRQKGLVIALPIILVLLILVLAVYSLNSEKANTSAESESTYTLQTDPSLTVENGDTVHIDYVGTINGIAFPGGSTDENGAYLVIGSNTYIDDFEEQLIGAHPGDEVEVNVTFPIDYAKGELAGEDAVFMVTIRGIYE